MTKTRQPGDSQTEAQAFFDGHAPFDQMEARHRRMLAERCESVSYPDGAAVLSPKDGRVEHLFIVAAGRVSGTRSGDGQTQESFDVGAGESFPVGALLGERPTRTVYRAMGETTCYRLSREDFALLFTESPVFRDFCLRGISSLLEQAQRHIQRSAAQDLGSQTSLDTPLKDLLRAAPVVCGVETTVREAVARMHQSKVGSIVVVDDESRPLGIFTLHDLRPLVVAGADLEQPVARAMTPEVHCLSADALAFEAMVLMAVRHIRHVVVVRDGRFAGVVSERDLFALQRVDVVHVMRDINRADSIDDVVVARRGIERLVDAMMAQGAGVEQLLRVITLLNDRTVTRVIDLSLREHGDPGVAFTWLAFGSEARGEQTLVTDQDNGILFEQPADETADAVRERLLPLATKINEALAACGFPLCKGNVMASNPALCLSAPEWRQTFDGIIRSSTPENLLRSSIYFDFRPVWGSRVDADHVHAQVLEQAAGTSLFLHMMAANALRNRPPLGLFRDFVTERHESAEGDTLDLKKGGLTPFVDGARLLGLEGRVVETNTLERFRRLGETNIATVAETEAWQRSIAFIQMLRMRLHQQQSHAGQPMTNRLAPATLNPMDRRVLREAFRQARVLQRKLEIRYQV